MAGEIGRSSSDINQDKGACIESGLEKELLKNSASFSFFQAMRLLRFLGHSDNTFSDPDYAKKGNVHVKPNLSLSFPPADVDQIEKKDSEHQSFFQMTANFLGLYGVSSPLPTFYTEDLLEEASEDKSVSRDFIDIINHRIYELFFRCLIKYRQYIQVAEEDDESHIQRLFSLVGLSEKRLRAGIPEPQSLLRYIGLFTQHPRSATGLRTVLQDALTDPPVDILPCMERQVKIPEDQRICMGVHGGILGKDSFLGEEIEDRGGKFRITIGPTDISNFQNCFPGNKGYEKIVLLTKLYMTDPLEYDILLILKKGEKETASLGDPKWSALGMNTWIFSGKDQWESRSIVYPDN
ncbi:MAG: type VI secretion system baseplate subunit TssG [Proteobacteria bacterium]|nr:type VI secretion system baseplate subunit TssG [Pseudomonadota bacterium]